MTTSSFTEEGPNSKIVIQWSGNISNIPSGWLICDGNNGTPNMLNKFVKNTSSATSSSGNVSGTNSYTISTSQMESHNHGGSTSSTGSHGHTVEAYGHDPGSWNSDMDPSDIEGTNDQHNTTTTSSYSGNHSHSHSINSSGSGSSVSNIPSYYKIAFIMKV